MQAGIALVSIDKRMRDGDGVYARWRWMLDINGLLDFRVDVLKR
jgi:hypothetical protein